VKRLLVIEGWTRNGFMSQVNGVFADPHIEVLRTSYCNSWGVHYAYIEYKIKEAESARGDDGE
jgi:hypothetical protein